MNFHKHSELEGKHAFLSASKYHWANYDVPKLRDAYLKFMAVQKGTELHAFASQCIKLGQKLPKSKKTLNSFVNDAIGYRMTSEQTLYFSDNCFGTADAISYRDNVLRIHDLKTGVSPTSMHQLEIYAALFYLEYFNGKIPSEDIIELRIYQSNDIIFDNPTHEFLMALMSKIMLFDREIESLKEVCV